MTAYYAGHEEHGRLLKDGELIVAKQRSGETGAFPANDSKRTLTFHERLAVAYKSGMASSGLGGRRTL